MKRIVVFVIALAILSAVTARYFNLENDLVQSFEGSSTSQSAQIVKAYQKLTPFQDRLFIDWGALQASNPEALRLLETLKNQGFRVDDPLNKDPQEPSSSAQDSLPLSLALALREVPLMATLGDAALETRATDVVSFAMMPGGTSSLEAVKSDPLGLQLVLGTSLLNMAVQLGSGASVDPAIPANKELPSRVQMFRAPANVDYEQIAPVYKVLEELKNEIRFIGAPLFAYENYLAVRHDIELCTTISILFNALLFFVFIRRPSFILFAVVGSLVSYVTGLALVELFYVKVYGVVIAFTSTFLGFNNEYLIHLSGLEDVNSRETKVSLSSAIGTTFIGFLVLLFGDSVIIRQIALVSLGGMAGFLAFLLYFRKSLRRIKIHGLDWPMLPLGRKGLGFLVCALALALVTLGWPTLSTSINEFRFASPLLVRDIDYFEQKAKRLAPAHLYATRVLPGGVGETFASLVIDARSRDLTVVHPLAEYRPLAEQQRDAVEFGKRSAQAIGSLSKQLVNLGVALPLNADAYRLDADLRPLSEVEFLQAVSRVAPQPWLVTVGPQEEPFLVFGVHTKDAQSVAAHARSFGWVSLDAQSHYNALLTDLSQQMAWLFLAGCCLMVVYLWFVQRSVWNVVYIFTPVLCSIVGIAGFFKATGRPLNIIHIMAFSLIIAVAVDYSSIAISTNYAKMERNKILLTGLSMLGSFGTLMLASHPVLRDLGMTVVFGSGISLGIALLFRFNREETWQAPTH